MIHEVRCVDRYGLAATLAEVISADLTAAVNQRGVASLIVSGGSTPRPLFERLRCYPVPWSQVQITLADERWVPVDDKSSNEALVRQYLLLDEAHAAQWVGLKNPAPTPEAGQSECERRLAALSRPWDVVVLGMGEDGHTASLFPGAAELGTGLDLTNSARCLAVRSPNAPHPRMSLTLATLLNSRRIIVHITGDDKWAVYQRALAPGPVEELPIRAILRDSANSAPNPPPEHIELYWAP